MAATSATKPSYQSMSEAELLNNVTSFKQVRIDLERLKKQKEAVEKVIKAELEGRGIEELIVGLYKVTYRNYTRKVFDRQKFMAEWPDLYATYTKEQSYKALSVM